MTKYLQASSMTRLIFRVGILLAVMPVVALILYGQSFYGSLVGTISDQSGGALSGASVTLTNTGTGERRQAQSGTGGDYQFLNLVPGVYGVQVEQSGFKKATRENVEVTVSGAVRADMSMQLGEVTQTVEVEAAAPLLQTENSNLSQVVNSRAIEELPVDGRNILILTALVPGLVVLLVAGKPVRRAAMLPRVVAERRVVAAAAAEPRPEAKRGTAGAEVIAEV